ncbi:MAG: 4'-phosphopantetheinyl transferase superfamily protein [Holosporaceae bacterium]|nr:4'-phosphopantetheinyl transferase superfamily protein [Holosporaceae bacterium]
MNWQSLAEFDIPFFCNGKEEKCVFAFTRTADFEISGEDFRNLMSADELKRFDSVGSEKVKKQYCLGRILTKKALSSFIGEFAFDAVSVLNEKNGCPFIESSEYAVSITHTNDVVAALVFKNIFSFGTDIENPRKNAREAMESILVDGEPVGRDLENLTVAWTLKESLSKALKSGFHLPFDEFEISDLSGYNDFFTCLYKKHPEFQGIAMFHNGNSAAFTYPTDVHPESILLKMALRSAIMIER